MKQCNTCKQHLPKTNEFFHYRNKKKGYLREVCKVCWSLYHAKHYKNNKQAYIDKARKNCNRYISKIDKILTRYKRLKGCIDCGNKEPIVLEFDHVRGTKIKEVSILRRNCNWKKIKEEIKKCDLRCANCHRLITHKRRIDVMVA
ncbi:hypothetical protein [Acinetobacter sp.]|uniref:hypothetical protein n=1 Tax=Acinetobacter sp. TaxID=472 RepID=UPI0037517C30